MLRSKTKWYNEGENNTKYFLSLEKQHYKQSTITQINVSDHTFVTSDKDILKQLLDEVEHDIMNYQNQGLCYLPKPKAEADNTDTRF